MAEVDELGDGVEEHEDEELRDERDQQTLRVRHQRHRQQHSHHPQHEHHADDVREIGCEARGKLIERDAAVADEPLHYKQE